MKALLLALSCTLVLAATAQESPSPKALLWSAGVPYQYDGAGNIKRIGTDVHVYDSAGRLVRSDTDGVSRSFSYDAYGNRLSCLDVGDCQYGRTISSATNRLVGATYDQRGNLIWFDGRSYTYDAVNMQTRERADSTGKVREYIYTADDERIAVYESGSWQWSLRDASGKVLREMASSDPPPGSGTIGTAGWRWTKDYVYRNGLLLASRQIEPGATSPTTYHYHLDHLGTPRRITDDSGRIVGAHSYHAFGPELTSDTNRNEPSPTRLKYTGHERDAELDYMHARFYDPRMGRFLSVDPGRDWDTHQPQSWNMYAYVRNNPINKVDPTGKWAFPWELLDLAAYEQSRQEWAASWPKFVDNPSWSTGLDAANKFVVNAADGAALLLPLVPAAGGHTQRLGVWALNSIDRGRAIENIVAKTDYSDWFRVGATNNGKFPLVDFQKGQDLVSLKSSNGSAGSISKLTDHIDALAASGAMVNGKPANLILDVRVQPGTMKNFQDLVKYGRQEGVTVVIKEFQ